MGHGGFVELVDVQDESLFKLLREVLLYVRPLVCGSREHLASTLDEAYRTLFRNPISVEPYQPGSASSGRTVLLEVFTGAGCPPCAGADLAVDAIRERYAARQVIVLMNHVHIPRPDPMTNLSTIARSTFYAVQYAPTFVIDGTNKSTGGSPREDALRPYDRLTAMIEDALKEPSRAGIALDATLEGRTVKVRTDVSGIESRVDDLRLRIALIERELRYGGENGIRFHPMVVRAYADVPVDPSRANGVTTEFDVDRIQAGLKQYLDEFEKRNDSFGPITFVEKMSMVDPANLGVVAFVQGEKDHGVLQSAFITVGATGSSR